jgi:hypothetical protein
MNTYISVPSPRGRVWIRVGQWVNSGIEANSETFKVLGVKGWMLSNFTYNGKAFWEWDPALACQVVEIGGKRIEESKISWTPDLVMGSALADWVIDSELGNAHTYPTPYGRCSHLLTNTVAKFVPKLRHY